MEDLQVQGQGLAITNFLFVMVWSFGYPAYVKFPGQETLDFYPVFTLFNAWMGLCIFIFLGLSSKRFRFVLSRWKKKCMVGLRFPRHFDKLTPLNCRRGTRRKIPSQPPPRCRLYQWTPPQETPWPPPLQPPGRPQSGRRPQRPHRRSCRPWKSRRQRSQWRTWRLRLL